VRRCSACGEVGIMFFARDDDPDYCRDCYAEIYAGIIQPAYGPILDDDDADDDDLAEDGRIDNAIKAMEDTR
jgi:hypothetical protein